MKHRAALGAQKCFAIGAILFRYRNRAGLTQAQVGARSGLGFRTVSHIECGRRTSTITFAQVTALLGACDVSLSQFEMDLEQEMAQTS